MKWIGAAFGAVALLLGGLWLVQGAGLVTIEPIACVADCETLTGPSPQWAITGALTLAAGAALLWFSLFRRRR